MSIAYTRVRSHSSPAKMTEAPDIRSSRIQEFVSNDLHRKTREQRISQSKPKLSQPAPAPSSTASVSTAPQPLKTRVDFSNTAPVIKKLSSKPKKVPPTPPQGIDSQALRADVQRAVKNFRDNDMAAKAYPPSFFVEFYKILNDCLAGQRMSDAHAYSVFTGMVIALSPHLPPDAETVLYKLEQLSVPK